MSEIITAKNIDAVIERNKSIEEEIEKQVRLVQMNPSIMKIASIPQLAFVVLGEYGLIQIPIDDKFWSGAIYVKDSKMIPVINTALSRASQYFAAWHEVYHLLFDSVSFDHYIESENIIEERKAESFAAHMLLSGLDQYYNELSEDDFLSKVFRCMSTFQAPYKAVLIALYEYAIRSENDGLKEKIKSVLDIQFADLPWRFRVLGLDDSLVLPSRVINTTPLQEKIKQKEKDNPELSYHADNEDYLKNLMKEISLITRGTTDEHRLHHKY